MWCGAAWRGDLDALTELELVWKLAEQNIPKSVACINRNTDVVLEQLAAPPQREEDVRFHVLSGSSAKSARPPPARYVTEDLDLNVYTVEGTLVGTNNGARGAF